LDVYLGKRVLEAVAQADEGIVDSDGPGGRDDDDGDESEKREE
jgi:hypothetical protein